MRVLPLEQGQLDLSVGLSLQPPPKPGPIWARPCPCWGFSKRPSAHAPSRESPSNKRGRISHFPCQSPFSVSKQHPRADSCNLHRGHSLPSSSEKSTASNSAFQELSYPCEGRGVKNARLLPIFLRAGHQQLLEAGRPTRPEDENPSALTLSCRDRARGPGHPFGVTLTPYLSAN